jgi:MATE family multidrug resistance protein
LLLYLAFKKHSQTSWKINFKEQKRLMKMGFPSGLHHLFEIGVFSLSTALVSRLGPKNLAAHSIVLNVAAFMFMVPLGISAAAAIRVAKFLGEGKKSEMIKAGDAAFLITFIFMSLSAISMFIFGQNFIRIFTSDAEVVQIGVKVILLAAVFQIADGIQVIGGGVLRGLGETKITAVSNFIGHWVIGLPIGYFLCFQANYGVPGLWTGLSTGLFIVAIVLFLAWRKKEQ